MDSTPTPLDTALAQAAADPAARPAFYRLLLDSQIYVIGHTRTPEASDDPNAGRNKLAVMQWQKDDGTLYLPFFTSLQALQREIDAEVAVIGVTAREFFQITRGARLVLNPSSQYGREFDPGEIAALLDTGSVHAASPRVVARSSEVLLGQPQHTPQRMLASLRSLLSKHGQVRAAYLAQMHDPAVTPAPVLLIGLDGDGDLTRTVQDVGAVAADTADHAPGVDVVLIQRGDNGLSDYLLREVEPFYRRSLGATLRGWFSGERR
ncbi:enhanced serine sensitivity protein SseB C-terminal domain-containing protein [Lysobacter sp. 5GHs7-4]|uniref:enhanced serine sensitivity protein SseB C-terminal domain-containing protein n=1 Tax=Lysobacter sp. 5GHs7-4 TaxID=2904253 RepID=UPI001E57B7A6|nr:enhanced serine sensitivity protein SseB C-terminal domain-containing protein [Lysobacter sp. 5GHs7-4]UHQ21570.1 enhanced serine sensitivity protein SseB C-terminal domain-containing protein [Lysobacter sp. 5GHs7-4]